MLTATLKTNAGALGTIVAKSKDRLKRVVVYFHTECQTSVSVPNPRPYKTPAPKGDPPRLRTGFGQRNIAFEIASDGMSGRVGITALAKYMLYLELKDHSWLLYTLHRTMADLKRIAGGG